MNNYTLNGFEHLKILLNQALYGIGLFEIGSEIPIFFNDAYYNIIGYTKEEYQKIISEQADKLIFLQDLSDFIQNGSAINHEFRIIRKDNQTLWIKLNVFEIVLDNKKYAIASFENITENKKEQFNSALIEQRYQIIIDELKAAVFEWNIKEKSFYCSTAYHNYAMSDVNTDDILNNRGPADVIHPDDIDIMYKFFKDTSSGEEKAESVIRLKMKDGSYRWSHVIGLYFKDINGNPERTLGIIIDINEERERNFMLNSMLNEIPGGVAIFKVTDTLECQYFSDGFAHVSGRTKEDINYLIENKIFLENIIAPSDYEHFLNEIRKRTAKGLPVNITFRYCTKEMGIGWLHLSATKMREEDGYPVYYCIFTNPSDETALYRNIVEDSASGVFVAERASRRIIYINEGLYNILGISSKYQNIQKHQSEIVLDKYRLLTDEQVNALKENEYTEFHIVRNEAYLTIMAKAIRWNCVDSYILYVSDETAEHEHQIQLQEFINRVPGGVGIFEVYDNKLHQIYMNDGFYRMISDTREQCDLRTHGEFINGIHIEDKELLKSAIIELSQGANETGFVYRSFTGKNEYLWVRLTAAVIKRADDKMTIYCSFTDYSEAMNAREKLEKSNTAIQQKYQQEVARRKLLEKNCMISICSNITQRKIIEFKNFNEYSQNYYSNMSLDEAITEFFKHIPDKNDRDILTDILKSTNIINHLKNEVSGKNFEYRSYQPDGSLHWIRASSTITEDLITGDIISYVYFYDIDDEKKEHLAAESVADDEIDYVMLLNVHTKMTKFIRLTQSSSKHEYNVPFKFGIFAVSTEYHSVFDKDKADVSKFFDTENLVKKLQDNSDISITYRQYNNKNIHRKKLRAFYLDKTHDDIVIVKRDITDLYREEQRQKEILQNAAEKAILASNAKTEFLSRMSHDMRTPLNGILGIAELSTEEYNPDALRNNIAKIKESGSYLLSLINDTLDFQRIESGKMKLDIRVVNMKIIFNNIIDIISSAAKSKNIDFRIKNLNVDLNCYVRIDAVRIKQIFINLLSNAVKFTPNSGAIDLEFECLKYENMTSHTRICIRDTGIGMSNEFIKNGIFKPFSQEHSDISAQYAGSGLGLSIVHSLVEMMGGKIEVESELNIGTTFTVYLSFERVDNSEAEKILQNGKQQKSTFEKQLFGKHILLVDDHPLNSEIAKKLLEKMGCIVICADNGEKGVQIFEQSTIYEFDIILMDIRMPVMNGLEASEAIRKLKREDAKIIPIIAMTANAYEEDVQKSLEAGMNAHLAKPIEPAKLYETIAKYVNIDKQQYK